MSQTVGRMDHESDRMHFRFLRSKMGAIRAAQASFVCFVSSEFEGFTQAHRRNYVRAGKCSALLRFTTVILPLGLHLNLLLDLSLSSAEKHGHIYIKEIFESFAELIT